MAVWEDYLSFELPAGKREEMLVALVLRDLLHGASYDVEVEEPPTTFAADFTAGDEMEGTTYRLLLGVEVDGDELRDLLQDFVAEILDGLLEEANETAEAAQLLDSKPASEVRFQPVPEDEERWDLVVPDWLSPGESEVPFGFRSFVGDQPWPSNATLDEHGRVVLVPDGDTFHLYGTPVPEDEEEDEETTSPAAESGHQH